MSAKYVALLFILLCTGFSGHAQNPMNEYSFIEVPEVYDFLRAKDQYQLNSMTKFFFEKHGFNAYFGRELPNVRKCDGLYAEVEGQPGFIYTRITVIIKDCEGKELFRSAEGKSKLKEFKKAYQQALRNAFKSFNTLNVDQPEIVVSTSNTETLNKTLNSASSETVAAKPRKPLKNGKTALPTANFTSYTHKDENYLLRKTDGSYALYQEVIGAENDLVYLGTVTMTDTDIVFTTDAKQQLKAAFDEQMNLIVQYPEETRTYVYVSN